MSFRVEIGTRSAGGGSQAVFLLSDATGANRAEVWPSLSCNCLRWSVAGSAGPLELLYVAPDWQSNPIPTRSGNPVLFPFPNRIRDGRFTWDGKEYQLPINGPNGRHAIHGFACRKKWRVLESSSSPAKAWVTAQFQGSIDAPETLAYWPADYRITLTIELEPNRLTFVARMDNPDAKPLPFGLGYHPYFAVPFAAGGECSVSSPARAMWKLVENVPTGQIVPPPPDHDLRTPRRIADLHLDDVYTDFGPQTGLSRQGRIEQPEVGAMEVWTSPGFRELVAFTPPHRKAICLEPYTCTTDAANLQARGIDAGWRVLMPGDAVTEVVEYRFRRVGDSP